MAKSINPDTDSHWSVTFQHIMMPLPNTTFDIIKYKLISFVYPLYLREKTERQYIVPSPELNLWYVLIGFLIVMPIILYMVYKEIAAIFHCNKSVIETPDEDDLLEALKITKQTIRCDVFAQKETIETVHVNRFGLPNEEGNPNSIGDSPNPCDFNHGNRVLN